MIKSAVLHNPTSELRGGHPEEWYHGTRHDFDEFDDPHTTHPLAYENDPEDGSHWNTILGNHFTSQHQIAERFGRTGSSANGHDDDEEDDSPAEGHVIHARLHIKRPKTYRSEHDMDQEVYEHEWKSGNHIDKHLAAARPDKDDDDADWYDEEEEFPRAHEYRGDSKHMQSAKDRDTGMYSQHREYWHPYATGWLNSHPDKHGIATRFRDRLKAQGHDGIVYGNDFEQDVRDKGHKHPDFGTHPPLDTPEVSDYNRKVPQHSIAAVPLDSRQIEVTQTHSGDGCKTPEEIEKAKHTDPLPHWRTGWGQPHLPGMDRTSAKHTYTVTTQGPQGYEDHEREVESPLYHGGRAKLQEGGLITPGRKPNAWGDGLKDHTYFTTDQDTALDYARQTRGHLYEVEPTGDFKPDHNQGDFKSKHPLRVVRKIEREEWPGWAKQATTSHLDLFHGTSEDAADIIRQEGLRPAREGHPTLTTDRAEAEEHAHLTGSPAVLHFRVPRAVAMHAMNPSSGDGEGELKFAPASVVHPSFIQHTARKVSNLGEESAANHAGKQTVWTVSSPNGTTRKLCQYHRGVHQSLNAASNGLAGSLGIPMSISELLEGSERGRCTDCSKDPGYALKLNRPGGFDRQQAKDSRQPRRQRQPYMPDKTMPLIPLKQSENAIKTYYHGTNEEAGLDERGYGHELHPTGDGLHLHPDEQTAWHHAIKKWQARPWGNAFPHVYRVHSSDNDLSGAEPTPGGGIKVNKPVVGGEVKYDHETHPPIRADHEEGEILYHGTSHQHGSDDYGLDQHEPYEHISSANENGSGPTFASNIADPGYAYASKSPRDAWHYANTHAMETGGVPHVYRVTPTVPEHLEKDPTENEHGHLRGNNASDMRSKSGFEVLGEVPLSRQDREYHTPEPEEDDDDDWGESHYGVKTADRQLALFPAPPRVTKPRSPKKELVVKAGPAPLPPVSEREPMRNQYNFHKRPGQRDHWYHGSMHNMDLSRQTGQIGKTNHWNTGIGPHFAGNEKLAGDFATADESSGQSGPGRITHARLRIVNPKHYKNEYEMDHEVLKDEVARGTFDADDAGVKSDLSLKRSPFTMARLSNHPDAAGIAQRFKQKLQDQGHDGITYKNSIETGQGLCAVPFEHDQVEVLQAHDFDLKKKRKSPGNPYQCDREEKTAVKKLPTLRMLAHDATENQDIRHCPFCGSGKIIGRADGSIECEFCHQYFTVQVQPQYPNFPQTIDGQPQQVPGMPGQVEQPSMEGGGAPMAPGQDPSQGGNPFAEGGEEDDGNPLDDAGAEEEGDGSEEEPPPFAKKSSLFKTASGASLDEAYYVNHLALSITDDRSAMLAIIRGEQGA